MAGHSTQLDKINPDIVKDPTLQKDMDAVCEKCLERDPSPDAPRHGAVFYQAPASFSSEERMWVWRKTSWPLHAAGQGAGWVCVEARAS